MSREIEDVDKQFNLVLIGSGGFALEVSQYIVDFNLRLGADHRVLVVSHIASGNADRYPDICTQLGYEPDLCNDLDDFYEWDSREFIICIGDPRVRYRIFEDLKRRGARFAKIIHHTSYIAPSATIGCGAVIAPFAFVGPSATVGDNCVLNVRSTVGHDAKVGHSSILSPHVDINGAVSCGVGCFLGAGAIVDPNVKVGSFCKVSSGSVVKRDVPDGFLVTGNPASGRRMFIAAEHPGMGDEHGIS